MKKILSLFTVLMLVALPFASIGQRTFTDGTLSYDITITGLNADAKSNLTGASLQVYLKPNQSRTEMVSASGSESNIYDSRSGKGFMLREYSGQKLMITMTKENWLQKSQVYDNLQFRISDEFVQIGNYKCKRATASLPNGKEFVVYFTPEIQISNTSYNNSFKNLPGLPVQFEMQAGNLVFKHSLTRISFDPVPSAKFESPRTGFRIMTYDENQQMKKGDK